VHAQRQGAFASLKVFEGDPVRCDPGSLEISHLDLLLSDSRLSPAGRAFTIVGPAQLGNT
jgi:hypothetical protein